jgi:hypothetical protein
MQIIDKEVYFDKYCDVCKYGAKDETDEHCHECLNNPMNVDSHKPVKFEKK